MTDIEQKALALVNEVGRTTQIAPYTVLPKSDVTKALYLAIEQHEAFRREVSDAIMQVFSNTGLMPTCLTGFVIPKPVDPLVELLSLMMDKSLTDADAKHNAEWLREALAKRGLEIRRLIVTKS